MPAFVPFAALRYAATDDLDALVAPPYDVLSEADAETFRQRSEHNIVHLDVPSGPDGYARSGRLLERWQRTGILVADAGPTFTIYRVRFTDAAGVPRDLAGVIGGLEVVDEGAGGVLPHERTTPKASTDRLDLTRATRANLSPVWGLALASGLTALLAEPGEPVGKVSDEGVEHVVERVADPARVAAIAELVGSDDVLIADGHHRYGVSRIYRDEVRAATGRTDTAAEQTLAYVGELVADQLSVAAIHRLYQGISAADLLAALRRRFRTSEIAAPTPETLAAMEADGYLVLVGSDVAWRLDPLPGAFEDVRELDGAWLEAALADVPHEVTYQHGLAEVTAAVRDGRAEAGVLIRPVSVAEIQRTAREHLLMPPKSTFFTPKLKTGLVLRPL
ncbi:DUF1015 family protein [Microlunatus parietis]|uniref:Uncharacterized protein (DUF1015 family) n=1 Tax=Microlunatus parietis TaxID=682979 RepID=A0A7Y9I391_9ACTN|nr:DUF1015 domain-containing protein [Microlunatus parietis]NYE69235.1 uncharacterized protein (DUF1015 family) [Microlunatus parietis]